MLFSRLVTNFDQLIAAAGDSNVHHVILASATSPNYSTISRGFLAEAAAYGHEKQLRVDAFISAPNDKSFVFNDHEIKTIAQAAEDHRASLPYEPRSLYGKIISEADRDINFERLLSRTILYSLDHYPDYVKEDTFKRVYAHMIEKYGPSGRIKLWLEYEPNVENLKEVHAILADETAFREAFEPLYSKYKQN